MNTEWLTALSFLAFAAVLVMGLLLAARLLRVKARAASTLKTRPYECGEEPRGSAWLQFHARYYLVALFFVLFDVEAVFLLPWARVSRLLGTDGFWAVVTFVVVLMLGWLYGLRKGALQWQ